MLIILSITLQLICLMLLDCLPGLKIEGADYLDMELLEGSQYEHLMLDDIGSSPKLEPGEEKAQTASNA